MAGPAAETLTIPSRLEAIDGARLWAATRARAAGFDHEAVAALEVAMTEALSNVILHAYGGATDQEIGLELAIDGEKLSLTVSDRGRPFDYESYTPPDLEEPAPGGYGVHLIDELMDNVVCDSHPGGGTRLTLIKYRGGTPKDRGGELDA